MRLTKMSCDGCGRKPSFNEWFKGEITAAGYPEWRHPAISFKEAGLPMAHEKREMWSLAWERLFGAPVPDDVNFLCPDCQTKIDLELPDMLPDLESEAEAKKIKLEAAAAPRREAERSYFGQ